MRLSHKNLLTITLFLVMLACHACQIDIGGNRWNQREVLSDSSISLYELETGPSDIKDLLITIYCKDNKASFIVESRWWKSPYEIRRHEQSVPPSDYLRLWAQIEKLGIWQLKRGDLWDHRRRVIWGGFRALGIKSPGKENADYRDISIDNPIVGVEINIKDRIHGFIWYAPFYLKDERYQKIISAINNFLDIREIIQKQRAQ